MKHHNSAQEHIANLQERWLHVDRGAAETTANLIDDVIDSVFKEPDRVGYELLQNADDSVDKPGLHVDVEYILLDDHLIVQHNGQHFAPHDIEGLCRYGAISIEPPAEIRATMKQYNPEKIGYKGIGFKSVFNLADRVWVNSRPYTFKFDKYHWEKIGRRLPWQIAPIACDTDALPEEAAPYLKADWVGFVFDLKADIRDKVKDRLTAFFDKEEVILFLRHVRSLKMFLQKDPNPYRHIRRSQDGPLYHLSRYDRENLRAETRWHLSKFTFPVPPEINASLQPLEKQDCPEKLKSAKETEITFGALVLEDDTIKPMGRPNLFSFLPTRTQYEFPFLVNGNFLLDGPRKKLLDTAWNEFIFEKIGYYQLEWFEQMARDERFKYEFAGLLIKYADKTPEIRNQKLNEGLNAASREVAFVPVLDSNKLKKAPETIVDQTTASTKLGDTDLVKKSFKEPREIADPKIKKIENLVKIGAEKFDREKLKDSIRQTNRYKKPEDNIRLIEFFFQHVAGITDDTEQEAWKKVLHETPFLLDQKKALGCPSELYFPGDNVELPFKLYMRFLHLKVYNDCVAGDNNMKDWLAKLGVAFPKPIEIIRRGLIPMIAENAIPYALTIPVAKYLFKHTQSLEDNEFQQLRNLPVLTSEGRTMKASSAYLSDVYQPKLPLENLLKKDIFIAPTYMEKEDQPGDWNRFWSKAGALQEMTIELHEIQSSMNSLQSSYSEYHDFLQPFLPDYNPLELHGLVNFVIPRYILYCQDFYFATQYWTIILKEKWSEVRQKCSRCFFKHSNGKSSIPSYFQFLARTKSYFPAMDGKCYTTREIYSQDLAHLLGGTHPIAALSMTKEQKQFWGVQNSLRLEDCVEILQTIAGRDGPVDKELITNIYQYILDRRFDQEEFVALGERIRNLELLAVNNTFRPLESLLYLDIPEFAVKVDSSSFIFLDLPEEKSVQFCELFGVKVAEIHDLVVDVIPADFHDDFEQVWKQRLLLISAKAGHEMGHDPLALQQSLWERTQQTHIQAASAIKLKLISEEKEIYQKTIRAWASKDTIYVSHPWSEAQTVFELMGILVHFFGLGPIERELELLLKLPIDEAVDWLSEQGIYVEDIKVGIEEDESEIAEVEKQEEKLAAKEEGLDIPLEPSTQREAFAEERPKYGAIESDVAQSVGLQGEQYIYACKEIQKFYDRNQIPFREVIWVNQNGETNSPYDFKAILDDENEAYWEVKSTPSPDKNEFPISEQELRFAFKNRERYHLIRVVAVGTNSPAISIFQKVINSIELGEILIKDAILKISKKG